MNDEQKFYYEVKNGESVTRFLHSDVILTPIHSEKDIIVAEVGMVEDYFDVEYPIRRDFLKDRLEKTVDYQAVATPHVYSAFEGEDVNFSAFISTPHHLACYTKTYFVCDDDETQPFEFKTGGGARIWVNQELAFAFNPFTRNKPQTISLVLNFTKGVNEIVIYFDDLAERDTTYIFQLKYRGQRSLKGFIPLDYDVNKLCEAETLLEQLYAERDCFKTGQITIINPAYQNKQNWIKELSIRINPKVLVTPDDVQDGNITEFKINDFAVAIDSESITLGDVSEFPAAGLTKCEFGVTMPNGAVVRKLLTFTVYHQVNFAQKIIGETLAERKRESLEYFGALDLDDVNVGLIKLLLEKELAGDEFTSIFSLIEAKGDCADFVLVPLLAVLTKYTEKFSAEMQARIKELSLNFRYWIDEPGNDVMWYFSENHALLFHVSQYFAGHLYPEALFTESNLIGEQVKELGKLRLEKWFEDFFKYGFSEWNSITYLPIDLIGFFSLYIAAPDANILALAKKGIDVTLEIAALHLHHGAMSSTYGRVYEHNLKTTPLGEMTNLTKVMWGEGYFNNALRATALFSISDYEPSQHLERYINLASTESLTAEYMQGLNRVQTYQYKTADYSLASCINYKAFKKGHQQHMMNVSLGNSNTHFWINHPGEYRFSGEGRPSFWAGNGYMPLIFQYQNVLLMEYHNPDGIPFIHLYLPTWDFDLIENHGNWLFLKKDDGYTAIYFANGYQVTDVGAVAKREVKSFGKTHHVVVRCGSKFENGSFEQFIGNISKSKVATDSAFEYYDYQNGLFQVKNGAFYRNNAEITYNASYDKKIEIGVRMNDERNTVG